MLTRISFLYDSSVNANHLKQSIQAPRSLKFCRGNECPANANALERSIKIAPITQPPYCIGVPMHATPWVIGFLWSLVRRVSKSFTYRWFELPKSTSPPPEAETQIGLYWIKSPSYSSVGVNYTGPFPKLTENRPKDRGFYVSCWRNCQEIWAFHWDCIPD